MLIPVRMWCELRRRALKRERRRGVGADASGAGDEVAPADGGKSGEPGDIAQQAHHAIRAIGRVCVCVCVCVRARARARARACVHVRASVCVERVQKTTSFNARRCGEFIWFRRWRTEPDFFFFFIADEFAMR